MHRALRESGAGEVEYALYRGGRRRFSLLRASFFGSGYRSTADVRELMRAVGNRGKSMRNFCVVLLILGLALPGAVEAADQAGRTYPGDGPRSRRAVISTTSLYIAFFSFYRPAKGKTRRESQSKVANQAQHLGVEPREMALIDRAALRFVADDALLSQEARRHFEGVRARGETVDPAVAQAFSDRQAALAKAAFRTLKENLSPKSYAGLLDYLKQDFSQTLTVMNLGHSTR